jgi:hypothetical protein
MRWRAGGPGRPEGPHYTWKVGLDRRDLEAGIALQHETDAGTPQRDPRINDDAFVHDMIEYVYEITCRRLPNEHINQAGQDRGKTV